ncbi:hypothetical protein ACU686_40540 [Yinghuangia aomiensis]
MPRSIFLGRTPEPGEPLWLADDRTWAYALLEVEAEECKGCGHPLSETTDRDAEFAYEAEGIRCHACKAAADFANAHENNHGSLTALQIHVTRRS